MRQSLLATYFSFEFLYFVKDIVLTSTDSGYIESNHERTTNWNLIQLLIQYVSNNAYVNTKLNDSNDIEQNDLNNIRARILDMI